MRYVSINIKRTPSKSSGEVHPFLTNLREDGAELPVCFDARHVQVMAGAGLVIPKPDGLETLPLGE